MKLDRSAANAAAQVADDSEPGAPRVNRRTVLAGAGGFAASAVLAPSIALAQTPFFAGRRIEILSGNSEGSTANWQLRAFANAIERLYPGTQTVVRTNTGGTSALTAAILAAAEPDGLTLGSSVMDSLLQRGSEPGLHDISEFTAIGSMRRSTSLLFASSTSGIESVDDLIDRSEPANLAVRSTASSGYLTALMCNAMLGTRIRPVTGYDSSERDLAFLNGEADLIFRTPDYGVQFIEEGTATAILTFDNLEVPDLYGNPPDLSDFAYDPSYQWIVEYFRASAYSRILVVPPGVPADRVEALRDLFMQVMAEPGFTAAVEGDLTITPTRGEVLERALASVIAALGDLDELSDRVERTLACGLQIAETGEPCPATG